MKLGELIVKYREDHGMSLRAFSRACGISPTYLSMLEKGVNGRGSVPVPSVETYKSIARAMGMDVDQLVRTVEDNVDLSSASAENDELSAMLEDLRSREDMRMLFKLAKGASPEDVRQAVAIIEALRKSK